MVLSLSMVSMLVGEYSVSCTDYFTLIVLSLLTLCTIV